MTTFFKLLDSAADATAEQGGWLSTLLTFLPFVLLIVVFYFMLIRPQKKRDKETQQMRANLEVGDEIVTIGGVIGTVVVIKDDYLLIETGSDRSKIRIARWAIQANNTPHESAVPEKKDKKKEK